MRAFKRTTLAVLAMIALGLGAMFAAGPAAAQEKTNRIDARKDWSIFRSDAGGRVCWIVTKPTASSAKRDGQEVKVRRDEIYLMVAVRPGDRVKNEVSFAAGYPFQRDSKVRAVVKRRRGDVNFEMFTDKEGAWLASGEEDDRMTARLKEGSEAIVTGVSTRGTTTQDTFSLLGFTAALAEAQALCS